MTVLIFLALIAVFLINVVRKICKTDLMKHFLTIK